MRDPDCVRYRIVAFFLDAILLVTFCNLVCWSFGFATGTDAVVLGEFKNVHPTTAPVFYALWLVSNVLYFGLLEGGRGATLGKSACGLVVVGDRGERIGYGRAFVRALVRPLSIASVVGWILAFVLDNQKTFHDIAARTLVYERSALPAVEPPVRDAPGEEVNA